MKQYNNTPSLKDQDVNVRVDVDVTKIVKYCCITSVLIVLIIFGSNVMRHFSIKNNNG